MKTKLVAVYGSLRAGLYNHVVLDNSELVAKGTITGFQMHSLQAYPALVPKDGCNPVKVEVYKVSPMIMNALDNLEGYPSFYNRKMVEVETEDGKRVAWVYYMNTCNGDVVESGDWVEYLGVE